jgi:hypothetical protein
VGLVLGVAGLIAPVAAAQTPPSGCAAIAPPGTAGETTCEYTATGPGSFLSATVNSWTIAVNGATVVQHGPLDNPSGTFESQPGDHVVVTMHIACNPFVPDQCGTIGAVIVGDNPS